MQGKDDHLTIIGESYGQGGGRISRTFLALSAIHQQPVTIQHIRAHRNNPRLQSQPLKGLGTIVHIAEAEFKGVRNGSQTVNFVPQKTISGYFRSEIGNGN